MIKSVQLKPFNAEKCYELPTYVYGNGVEKYALFGTVTGNYKITQVVFKIRS